MRSPPPELLRSFLMKVFEKKSSDKSSVHSEVYLIQHYVIKFVSDLRQVLSTPVSSTNKTDRRDITEISLKVALNTITLILKYNYKQTFQLNWKLTFVWVCKWLLFIANSSIFQLYHDENKLISMRWWWSPLCSRPTRWVGFSYS